MGRGGAAGLPPLFAEPRWIHKGKGDSRPVLPRTAPPSPRPIQAFIPKTKVKNKGGQELRGIRKVSREPSSSSLVMVGTVHRDPKGFGKLLRILEREAPNFITVEISPYALEFRAKQASHLRAILRENLKIIQREEGGSYRRFLSYGEIQGIFLLLKVPFEWRAAAEYARRSRIGVKAIDLSAYSEEKLAWISELIHIENLRALLRSSSPAIGGQVILQNKRAQNLWNRPLASGLPQEEIQERERHMAGEIRRVMEEGNKRKILHVGGWEHLLPASQGKSLFARLEKFKPCRILLTDDG